MMMINETNAGRTAGAGLRRRGIALSSSGIERFLAARKQLNAQSRANRHPTLAECATRAKVGLRTLTRCLRGERVDRRSIELIFIGVGLELGPQDVVARDHDVRGMLRRPVSAAGATGPTGPMPLSPV